MKKYSVLPRKFFDRRNAKLRACCRILESNMDSGYNKMKNELLKSVNRSRLSCGRVMASCRCFIEIIWREQTVQRTLDFFLRIGLQADSNQLFFLKNIWIGIFLNYL